MSAIQNLFQQTQFSEATYANLTTAIKNQDALLAVLNAANKETFGGSFSIAQAKMIKGSGLAFQHFRY